MSGPAARVVFVGGLGRSGTTLVERMLGELPGFSPLGEVVHMWERGVRENERCGCGEAFHDCPFWRKVGEVAFGGWAALDAWRVLQLRAAVDRTRFVARLTASRLPPAFRRAVEEYVGYYLRLYAAVAEVTGCEVVVDSSKHASLACCLRWAAGLDLRVLHVVRDSRGVAYSWTKAVRRPETNDPAGYMTRYSPVGTAAQWNAQNLAFELLGRRGTPTRLLRYEDLVAAPTQLLRELADFVGVPVGGDDLAFLGEAHADLSVAHTASGNPMRFQTGRVRLRRDDAWRSRLAARDRATVTALTMPLLARYGYPVGRREGR